VGDEEQSNMGASKSLEVGQLLTVRENGHLRKASQPTVVSKDPRYLEGQKGKILGNMIELRLVVIGAAS
jgi:hypothetical protein